MKTFLIIISLFTIFYLSSCNQSINSKPDILLITGGHNFDTLEFFATFNSMEEFQFHQATQPVANELIRSESGKNYDAYIFYDMWEEISEEEKQAYLQLTKVGKPLLFLHHSIVSYQSWPEFKQIVGGKYHTGILIEDSSKLSGYTHDLDLNVTILEQNHPIVQGLENFIIRDEGYDNIDLTDQIHPILGTDHPDCHPILGWTNQYNDSRVVYLMLGHDKKAYNNESFQMLVKNSLNWLLNQNK